MSNDSWKSPADEAFLNDYEMAISILFDKPTSLLRDFLKLFARRLEVERVQECVKQVSTGSPEQILAAMGKDQAYTNIINTLRGYSNLIKEDPKRGR